MKKLLPVFFIFLLIIFYQNSVYAANESTTLVINNTEINEKGKLFNEKFLVPARSVYESMGAEVLWDNQNRAIVVKKNDTSVTVKLGSSKMTINGVEKSMEHTPVMLDNTLFVAAKTIGDPFDYISAFDEKNNIMFFYPNNYTYINIIMPVGSFPKIIKGIDHINIIAEYEKLFMQAPDSIIFRNVVGLIFEYPSNPFPSTATIHNTPCLKETYCIEDIDDDYIPELIIQYLSSDGKFDDYVVYTYKNNNIYYCGNVRNVLDCGPSDYIYFLKGIPGMFIYDYRVDNYWQVILNDTTINRGTYHYTKEELENDMVDDFFN